MKIQEALNQAKKILLEALIEEQRSVTGIKAADPDRRIAYQDLLERMAGARGKPLFYPYISEGVGRGALVSLADGSVKYDFISGIGVHYFGHHHPLLVEAAVDAAMEDTMMQGHLQQGVASLRLMETIVAAAGRKGADLKYCFLTSSGAMANENALKIIFQKKHPASRVLAFERCFSGRTLACAQITDKAANREGLPKTLDVDYLPFYNQDAPEESLRATLAKLETFIARYPGQYAGMCFELIQGEGGYYGGRREYFRPLMLRLKELGIAVMIDEIQTIGRTNELFAFQHYGLDDLVDVVTFGKMTQVCGTLFSDEYNPKSGLLSQTFTSSSMAIHASQAILDEVCHNGYLGEDGKIMSLSQYFRKSLEGFSDRRPDLIRGPFGYGGMLAFTVFDGEANKTQAFLKQLYENGVIAFAAGAHPQRVRMLLPMGAVEEKDIDAGFKIIEETLLGMTL